MYKNVILTHKAFVVFEGMFQVMAVDILVFDRFLFKQNPHVKCSFWVLLSILLVLLVFQLFNGDSLQIHVSWTILTSTQPVHYPDTGGPVVVLFP